MLGFCKRWIYKIIDEGIEQGYITRTQQNFNGRFQNTVYYFSEEPKFKKCSPCAQNRHAVKCTPSLYSKTDEFEASSQKPPYEEDSKPLERDDIDALPFARKDKRILSKYPREAIAYAKRCISRMPVTPKKPVAVFTNLCKSFLSKESQSALKQERPNEGWGRLKNNLDSKQQLINKVIELCKKAKVYFSDTRDDLLVAYGDFCYHAYKSDALFEKTFNECIRILNEKISRTT